MAQEKHIFDFNLGRLPDLITTPPNKPNNLEALQQQVANIYRLQLEQKSFVKLERKRTLSSTGITESLRVKKILCSEGDLIRFRSEIRDASQDLDQQYERIRQKMKKAGFTLLPKGGFEGPKTEVLSRTASGKKIMGISEKDKQITQLAIQARDAYYFYKKQLDIAQQYLDSLISKIK